MNTEAWGILLGHTTGFAATRAAAQLQQAVPRNFFCVAFMPFVSFGCLGEIGEALGGTGKIGESLENMEKSSDHGGKPNGNHGHDQRFIGAKPMEMMGHLSTFLLNITSRTSTVNDGKCMYVYLNKYIYI